MELTAVYRCVAALDVHQAKLTVCILYENDAGEVATEVHEFGGFNRDLREMAAWVGRICVALAPLVDRLAWHLLQRGSFHADKTPGPKIIVCDYQSGPNQQ